MASERTANMLTITPDVRMRVEKEVCSRCTDLCWQVEVWCHDLNGSGVKTCVFWRDHMPSQARAIEALGRWLLGHSSLLLEAESRAYQLEHQMTLL